MSTSPSVIQPGHGLVVVSLTVDSPAGTQPATFQARIMDGQVVGSKLSAMTGGAVAAATSPNARRYGLAFADNAGEVRLYSADDGLASPPPLSTLHRDAAAVKPAAAVHQNPPVPPAATPPPTATGVNNPPPAAQVDATKKV